MRLIHVSTVGLLLLAACGDQGDAPNDAVPADGAAAATTTPSTAMVEIAMVYERVEYYGACGNETLMVDSTTYYPIHNEAFPGDNEGSPVLVADRYPVVGALVGLVGTVLGSASAAPMVAPPGPGDDIGDLTVYVDGIARFESDSGWVIWLTDEEQTYGWEC